MKRKLDKQKKGECFMPNSTLDPYQDLSNAVRFLSIDAVEQAQSGHPGCFARQFRLRY